MTPEASYLRSGDKGALYWPIQLNRAVYGKQQNNAHCKNARVDIIVGSP
jgi:hypothetical protein